MDWWWLSRYEDNQSSILPEMPNTQFIRFNSILWLTVSKAAEMSYPTSTVSCFLSIELYTLSRTRRKAVSMEWLAQYADWNRQKLSDSNRCGLRRTRTRRSIIFEIVFRFEMIYSWLNLNDWDPASSAEVIPVLFCKLTGTLLQQKVEASGIESRSPWWTPFFYCSFCMNLTA